MALPASFSTNTSPTGGDLDDNFAAVAAMGRTRCTAVGTNSIALTPVSDQPAVPAYVDQAQFAFEGVADSTSSVQGQVGALALLPVYTPDGTQAGAGDILNGFYYVWTYLASLNSSNGGFMITSALPSSTTAPSALGSTQGLLVTNNASTPNTQIDITALSALLVTTAGLPKWLGNGTAPSVTIDLTTVGANGMDAGSRPTSGWVYCYLISNGSVTAGIATTTAPASGAPTLPSGYTYRVYVGAMFCDSAQNLMRTRQRGADAQYQLVLATNTLVPPVIASGSQVTYSTTSPALAAVSVATIVPATASLINVLATSTWKGGTAANVLAAPSTAWGGAQRGPTGSGGLIWPIALSTASGINTAQADIELEATTIAWCSSGSGGAIACMGWHDGWVNA